MFYKFLKGIQNLPYRFYFNDHITEINLFKFFEKKWLPWWTVGESG